MRSWPLTGLRIVAALWVVLFHLRGVVPSAQPGVVTALSPILHNGDLGVELFFGLSGFVLTLNHVDKMGHRIDRGADQGVLLGTSVAGVAGLLHDAESRGSLTGRADGVRQPGPGAPDEFTVISYLRQLFVVVL